MRRLVVLVLVVIISAYATNVSAYNWIKEYEFPATRLVKVNGTDKSSGYLIYSFIDEQKRPSLLVICHGEEINGEYRVYMGREPRKDYAQEVDEIIRWHMDFDEIDEKSFEKVYLLTSYAGYAPQKTVIMPVLKKDLQMILYNKDLQGYEEIFDSQGKVMGIAIFREFRGGFGRIISI